MIGEYYVEQIDNDYGIFHTDIKSGFCYALFSTKQEADLYVKGLNHD